ncbi:MAG TPA: TlpA disulfide reductase family protein [Planctomycetota bacterium]|nr:TlpA disulfide reductase family protein [Planctomycetota bacterium]
MIRSATAFLLLATFAGSTFAAGKGDVAPPLEGKTWVSADGAAPQLEGKVYVVDFYFAACGPCNAAVPHLREIAAKYSSKDVCVVALSLDNEKSVRAFKKKHGIEEYALLSDGKASARSWGVSSFPTAFIVGKDGKIAWRGHPIDDEFEPALKKALN